MLNNGMFGRDVRTCHWRNTVFQTMHERLIPSLSAVGKQHLTARDDREKDTILQHRAVCSYLEPCFVSPIQKVSLVFLYTVPERAVWFKLKEGHQLLLLEHFLSHAATRAQGYSGLTPTINHLALSPHSQRVL